MWAFFYSLVGGFDCYWFVFWVGGFGHDAMFLIAMLGFVFR